MESHPESSASVVENGKPQSAGAQLDVPPPATSVGEQAIVPRQGEPVAAAPVLTVDEVMDRVGLVASWLPEWRHAAEGMLNAATGDNSTGEEVEQAFRAAQSLGSQWCPGAADDFLIGDGQDDTRCRALVGDHIEQLWLKLREAEQYWPAHTDNWREQDVPATASLRRHAALLVSALQEADTHAAFLDLCWRIRNGHVSEGFNLKDVATRWRLDQPGADRIRDWLRYDPPKLDRRPLPCLVDPESGSVYRKADGPWEIFYTTTAAVWGLTLGFGALVALFALLDAASLTSWPAGWAVKFLVLYLFVLGGALVHVASRSLSNIHFDDPLQIYAATRGMDWLRLRWLAILRLLIPIVVVTGSLWGAGNVPSRFQDLGVAILSGYSADSLFLASLSRVRAAAVNRSPEATPTR